jgi:ribosomal protein S27AE
MAQLRVEAGAENREIALPATGDLLFLMFNGQPRSLQITVERPARYLAALLFAGRHWLVLTPPGGADLAIDGVPVPAFKILDDKSVLSVGGVNLRMQERVEEVVTVDSAVVRQKKVCPVCGAAFAPGDHGIYCPTCSLAHHADCLERAGRCASYPFCGYTLAKEEATA